MRAEPSFAMIEQRHGKSVVSAWKVEYFFDTTFDGMFEPLPAFNFVLHEEQSRHDPPRPYRLYENGMPSTGGQWFRSIDHALDRARYVVSCYVSGRRARIEEVINKRHMDLWREQGADYRALQLEETCPNP